MNLIALLAVRNEEQYIQYCLNNLFTQGFDVYLIDNESEDSTVNIAKKYLGKGIINIEKFPYNGTYEWKKILELKENLAEYLKADWFMHCDADEIRLPHFPFKTIKEALIKIEKLGYNIVDFKEYVFMPEPSKNYIGLDYNKLMKYYYSFVPAPLHRLNLWKKTNTNVDLVTRAGHHVNFENRKIYPNSFILKHFIFLSKQHAIEKYIKKRKYNKDEVERLGWHGWRASFKEESFFIPPRSQLKKLEKENDFDNSDPKTTHQFYLFDDRKE